MTLTPALRTHLLATDIGMLAYWSITALSALGVVALPEDWLYKDYHEPVLMAWNWSFAPLDVLFSVMGLAALRLIRRGDPMGRTLLVVSLTLTFCAGLMAISFWTLRLDFDAAWWAVNLYLMIWPVPYLLCPPQRDAASA